MSEGYCLDHVMHLLYDVRGDLLWQTIKER